MKPTTEMTLQEIEHLLDSHDSSLTFSEKTRGKQDIANLKYMVSIIRKYQQTYTPKEFHTCPQCREPKKEKDPEPFFRLDK